jgi:hypothetical protein
MYNLYFSFFITILIFFLTIEYSYSQFFFRGGGAGEVTITAVDWGKIEFQRKSTVNYKADIFCRIGDSADTTSPSWTAWTLINSGDDIGNTVGEKTFLQLKVEFSNINNQDTAEVGEIFCNVTTAGISSILTITTTSEWEMGSYSQCAISNGTITALNLGFTQCINDAGQGLAYYRQITITAPSTADIPAGYTLELNFSGSDANDIWKKSMPSGNDIRIWYDGIVATETTLTSDFGTLSYICNVSATTDFPDCGLIQIDNEYMVYSQKSATQFFIIRREIAGSNQVSHSSGASVKLIQEIEREIKKISPNNIQIAFRLRKTISAGNSDQYILYFGDKDKNIGLPPGEKGVSYFFYDDFEDNIISELWQRNTAAPASEDNGELILNADADTGWGVPAIWTKIMMDDYIMYCSIRQNVDDMLGDVNFWVLDLNNYYAFQHETRSKGYDNDLVKSSAGSKGSIADFRWEWAVGDYVNYEISVISNTIKFQRGAQTGEYTDTSPLQTTDRKIGFSGNGKLGGVTRINWVGAKLRIADHNNISISSTSSMIVKNYALEGIWISPIY